LGQGWVAAMRLFELGMWEIVLMAVFFLGVFAILCVVISVAVMMVIITLEAVDDYKRWRK
jgi:hypothetical protein